jgi:hypothetical protein
MVRVNRSTLSPDSGTCGRPPAIRLTAFNAQPPNLPPALLMDVDFAAIGQLVQRRRPHIRFLSIGSRLCSTLTSDPASRRQPLRFAITSPPSGCEEDFHLQAVIHARRTKEKAPESRGLQRVSGGSSACYLLHEEESADVLLGCTLILLLALRIGLHCDSWVRVPHQLLHHLHRLFFRGQ